MNKVKIPDTCRLFSRNFTLDGGDRSRTRCELATKVSSSSPPRDVSVLMPINEGGWFINLILKYCSALTNIDETLINRIIGHAAAGSLLCQEALWDPEETFMYYVNLPFNTWEARWLT